MIIYLMNFFTTVILLSGQFASGFPREFVQMEEQCFLSECVYMCVVLCVISAAVDVVASISAFKFALATCVSVSCTCTKNTVTWLRNDVCFFNIIMVVFFLPLLHMMFNACVDFGLSSILSNLVQEQNNTSD